MSSDDFLCLGFWHRTNRWHDFLLPHDLLWLTCWFLLPILSVLPVSMFCCWWISLLSCAPIVFYCKCILFLQRMYCYSCGTEYCTRTCLSTQLFVCLWDGLEDFLVSFRVSRLCLFRIFGRSFRYMTVFWSPVHQQRHVTTCLMKFAIGERNVAIRYKFCVLVV